MPINEPRIWEHKPKWVDLEEIERKNGLVWFRTKTGRISASIKEVEAWEYKAKNSKKSTLFE